MALTADRRSMFEDDLQEARRQAEEARKRTAAQRQRLQAMFQREESELQARAAAAATPAAAGGGVGAAARYGFTDSPFRGRPGELGGAGAGGGGAATGMRDDLSRSPEPVKRAAGALPAHMQREFDARPSSISDPTRLMLAGASSPKLGSSRFAGPMAGSGSSGNLYAGLSGSSGALPNSPGAGSTPAAAAASSPPPVRFGTPVAGTRSPGPAGGPSLTESASRVGGTRMRAESSANIPAAAAAGGGGVLPKRSLRPGGMAWEEVLAQTSSTTGSGASSNDYSMPAPVPMPMSMSPAFSVPSSSPLTLSSSSVLGSAMLASSSGSVENSDDPAVRARKRGNVVHEIVQTEAEYLDTMTVLLEVYQKPMLERGLVTQAEATQLFSNAPQLLPVNRELYQQLEQRRKAVAADPGSVRVGDVFFTMADALRIYASYFINHPSAHALVDRLTEENRAFADYLEQCQFQNPRVKGRTLHMFLSKPFQRVCQYPLLLKELSKVTPEGHDDYADLQRGLRKMEEVVNFLNERKREQESKQRVVDLANALERVEGLELVTVTRRVVLEGMLNAVKGALLKRRQLVLCNDLVLVIKPKPTNVAAVLLQSTAAVTGPRKTLVLKQHFALKDIRVIDVADRDGMCYIIGIQPKESAGGAGAAPGSTFAATSSGPVQHNFMCSSTDEKQTWITQMKKLIKEYQMREVAEKRALGPGSGVFDLPKNPRRPAATLNSNTPK